LRSNYKKLGELIRSVDIRNYDLMTDTLLGLSISKEFIPSVANIIGTDMKKYKIIHEGQFACSLMQVRRDKKLPVAMLRGMSSAIVSQAYIVFEGKDENVLLPEYLMMWMSRTEFDREACFLAIGGVRGSLDWEDFLNMELLVPSINSQHLIVNEYLLVAARIDLNELMMAKLEQTIQAIFKHWFIESKFPISTKFVSSSRGKELEGMPHQASGGEMSNNDPLGQDIPSSWTVGSIDHLAQLIDGDRGNNYPSKGDFSQTGFCLFLNTGNVTKTGFNFSNNIFISDKKNNQLNKGLLEKDDIVLTTRGTVGNSAIYSDVIEFKNMRINSGMIILRAYKDRCAPVFLYSLLRSSFFQHSLKSFLTGSAQQHLPIRDLKKIPIPIPESDIISRFEYFAQPIQAHLDLVSKENRRLVTLKEIVLSKLAARNSR